LRAAKLRPNVPIIAACYHVEIARQLAIVWGIYPIVIDKHVGEFNLRKEIDKVCKIAVEQGFTDPNKDLLTFTAGLPFGTPGTTNIIRVVSASGPDYWFDENDNSKMKKFEDSPNVNDNRFM
jgi:pyruvate kinase